MYKNLEECYWNNQSYFYFVFNSDMFLCCTVLQVRGRKMIGGLWGSLWGSLWGLTLSDTSTLTGQSSAIWSGRKPDCVFSFFFFFFVSSCPCSVGCSLKRLLPHFHELVCYDFMIIYDSLSACTRTCSCCPLITTALSHQLVSVIAQRWGSAWESGRAHTMGHTHTHIQSCGVLSHHSHRNLKYLTWCPAFVLEIASKKESGRTQV